MPASTERIVPDGVAVTAYGLVAIATIWLLGKAWPVFIAVCVWASITGAVAYPPYGG